MIKVITSGMRESINKEKTLHTTENIRVSPGSCYHVFYSLERIDKLTQWVYADRYDNICT